MSTQPKPFLTPQQYLEIERKAEYKSEYPLLQRIDDFASCLLLMASDTVFREPKNNNQSSPIPEVL